MDPQAEAYRDASIRDWVTDSVLAGCVVHDPGAPVEQSPEEWDAAGWDSGRRPPKGRVEAQALLASRIADPTAPDDDTTAGAYDGGM